MKHSVELSRLDFSLFRREKEKGPGSLPITSAMTPTPGHVLLGVSHARVTGRACTHAHTLVYSDTKGCSKVAERTMTENYSSEKKSESDILFFLSHIRYFDNDYVRLTISTRYFVCID